MSVGQADERVKKVNYPHLLPYIYLSDEWFYNSTIKAIHDILFGSFFLGF